MLNRTLRHATTVTCLTISSIAFAYTAGPTLNGRAAPKPDVALEILREAHTHGLNSSDYQLEELTRLHQSVQSGERDLRDEYEGLMTDALLRLFRDLRPQLVKEYGYGDSGSDLFAFVVAEAIRSGSLRDFYNSLVPRHSQYRALQDALLRQEQAAMQVRQHAPIGRGQTLRLGDTGARVNALRARLLAGYQTLYSDHLFDKTLEEAVKAYQAQHGLEPDGIVGRQTQQHLDMPATEKAARIRVALARWRELPVGLGDDYVHVNIPEYRLEFVRDGVSQVQMNVVVGSKDDPTPAFNDEIEYLVFNPFWNVPRGIALEEIVPKAADSPEYLSRNNYEVLHDGKVIDENSVNWAAINHSNFNYRIRQRPGPSNALGAVKFLFPNAQNIYLHDSPARNLYDRTVRAFSHGCIRLEDPVALAEALLEHQEAWNEDRIDQAMNAGSRRQVNLDQTVPVYLTYITTRVMDTGELALFDDIYGRDRALMQRYL